ncbi:MAG: hypothetical protein ACREPM_21065 [Gemmatimonadaceae bacterium]
MLATLSMRRSRRAMTRLALLVAVATPGPFAVAQTQSGSALPAGEPARFLQRYIGLTPGEIDKARQGTVVTKVLNTTDQDEVALFGIVAVDAPRDEVTRRVHDLPTFLRSPGRAAFGLFGTPATPNDVRDFVVEQSLLDELKGCHPGDCDLKLPTANIDEFNRMIDWSSPNARTQVETMVRQRTAEYVNAYRKGGTAAMVEYGDQKTTGRASDVFTSLLAESPYLFDYVPPFQKYLSTYPAGSLPDVTDAIYWSADKMSSLRPIFSINHVSIYSPPGAPLTLVSVKQLYASHYFLGAFTLTTVLDRPDAPGGRGIYYFVVQRMRFDHLPSNRLLNIRGRVIGKLQDVLRDDLIQRKAVLEGRS